MVEGIYDVVVLSELVKKCLPGETEIIARPCDGKDRLMRKFPGYLQDFCYAKAGSHVDKALVIRDLKDPGRESEVLNTMRNSIVRRTYPFTVNFGIVVRELETWLLADEQAISSVTRAHDGKSTHRVNEDLESIAQPKEKLKNILSSARVIYTAAVAKRIAMESDLSTIEYRCPRFREFRQSIIDC